MYTSHSIPFQTISIAHSRNILHPAFRKLTFHTLLSPAASPNLAQVFPESNRERKKGHRDARHSRRMCLGARGEGSSIPLFSRPLSARCRRHRRRLFLYIYSRGFNFPLLRARCICAEFRIVGKGFRFRLPHARFRFLLALCRQHSFSRVKSILFLGFCRERLSLSV